MDIIKTNPTQCFVKAKLLCQLKSIENNAIIYDAFPTENVQCESKL